MGARAYAAGSSSGHTHCHTTCLKTAYMPTKMPTNRYQRGWNRSLLVGTFYREKEEPSWSRSLRAVEKGQVP